MQLGRCDAVERVSAVTTTRRQALKLLGAGAALGLVAARHGSTVMAQGATPAALTSYPEVMITGVDYGYQMPDTFEGGYTRVTLKNASPDMTHTALFLAPHPDKTIADVEAALKAAPTAADLGKILAVASSIGGPASIDPGQTSTVIMNLPAGQYVVFCPIPGPNGAPHYALGMQKTVTVTAPSASLPAPTAELTVDLADFKFENLPDTVPAGQHIWEVTNKGPQVHEMTLFSLAPGISPDQFKAMLSSAEAPASPAASPMAGMAMGTAPAMASSSPAAGSPAAGAPPVVDFGGVGAMNPGYTVWAVLDLQPGTDVAVCFVPDEKTGIPHFMEGMFMPFTVK